jgi:hypothetical protein
MEAKSKTSSQMVRCVDFFIVKLKPKENESDNSAERLSSATNVLGAECAARSTIRDKHVRSL